MKRNDRMVADGITWHRLESSKRWDPEPGESIAGEFLGFIHKEGEFGPYRAARIRTKEHVLTVTGTMLMDQLDNVDTGDIVMVVFHGMAQMRSGGKYKVFESFVAPEIGRQRRRYVS